MIETEAINNSPDRVENRQGNIDFYYAVERIRNHKMLTLIGVSFIVLGILIVGAGIFFRLTYDPASFNVSGYTLANMQAYAAGLAGIIVGGVLAAGGILLMELNRRF